MNIGLRRAVSYIVLIILSFLCLFWFYVLFINATRSNSELVKGFTAIPSTHLMQNLHNVLHGTLPMIYGKDCYFYIYSYDHDDSDPGYGVGICTVDE